MAFGLQPIARQSLNDNQLVWLFSCSWMLISFFLLLCDTIPYIHHKHNSSLKSRFFVGDRRSSPCSTTIAFNYFYELVACSLLQWRLSCDVSRKPNWLEKSADSYSCTHYYTYAHIYCRYYELLKCFNFIASTILVVVAMSSGTKSVKRLLYVSVYEASLESKH